MIRSLTLSEIQIEKMPPVLCNAIDKREAELLKPRCRSDCSKIPRPCPFVSCRYNLYCDITKRGSLKLNFPKIEPQEMIASCALDIAELGGCTLQEIGDILNITRERVRQVQDKALRKLDRKYVLRKLAKELDK